MAATRSSSKPIAHAPLACPSLYLVAVSMRHDLCAAEQPDKAQGAPGIKGVTRAGSTSATLDSDRQDEELTLKPRCCTAQLRILRTRLPFRPGRPRGLLEEGRGAHRCETVSSSVSAHATLCRAPQHSHARTPWL